MLDMAGRSTSGRKLPKTVIVHQCSQEEVLSRMNTVLFGNGHPEDGLAFLVRAYIKDQADMHKTIQTIEKTVAGLHQKYDETYDAAEQAQHALDMYKLEVASEEKGKDEVIKSQATIKAEKRDDFLKKATAISVAIAALGVLVTMYFSYQANNKTSVLELKVDNLGTPIVVDKRGEPATLPDGHTLKMWPKDFIDSVAKDSVK